mgnify:CR=1 FL=1
MLERLCAVPEIGTVEESARAWDVRLTVLTRSWEQMTRDVLPLVRADPAILRAQLTVATRLHAIGNNWRLDVLSPEQQRRVSALHPEVRRPHGATPARLGELTSALQRDGRATAAEIAAATGTHPTTAARHLRQALETGLVVQVPLFVNVGERTNVTGSRRFARLILEDRFTDAVEIILAAQSCDDQGTQFRIRGAERDYDGAYDEIIGPMVRAMPRAREMRTLRRARVLLATMSFQFMR